MFEVMEVNLLKVLEKNLFSTYIMQLRGEWTVTHTRCVRLHHTNHLADDLGRQSETGQYASNTTITAGDVGICA
jgi:hypothetical protein